MKTALEGHRGGTRSDKAGPHALIAVPVTVLENMLVGQAHHESSLSFDRTSSLRDSLTFRIRHGSGGRDSNLSGPVTQDTPESAVARDGPPAADPSSSSRVPGLLLELAPGPPEWSFGEGQAMDSAVTRGWPG